MRTIPALFFLTAGIFQKFIIRKIPYKAVGSRKAGESMMALPLFH